VDTGVIIDITWLNHKMAQCRSSEQAGQRMFGRERWSKLKVRIALLETAPSLAHLRGAPGKWHPLGADRTGQWSARLDGNYRLIIVPDHEPMPLLPDGGLDAARVTKVKIVGVVDYHGR
jgi:proteic killer suppression protein